MKTRKMIGKRVGGYRKGLREGGGELRSRIIGRKVAGEESVYLI